MAIPSVDLTRDTSEHLRLLVDEVREYAVFMLDPKGYVLTWNTGAANIKGYKADEIIGHHFSAFYTPEDRENGRPERLLATAEEQGSANDEGWRLRKDGSRFWASVVITAVRRADGTLLGFGKVTRDDTERRQAQEQLQESEKRFHLLVDSVPDYAIYMLDRDGIVVSWNSGAERIKGYWAEEVLGRHFSIFYPDEDVANGKPQRDLAMALENGHFEEEAWRIRKDGTRFWASAVVTPIYDHDRVFQGFAKVTRDMTERKRAQEQLLASQELSLQLASENRAKDEFLGIVSHELRTPLTVIYGSARFLATHLEQLDPAVRSDALQGLVTEAEKFRGLVENLLVLAHVDMGETIPLVPESIAEAANRAIDMFRRVSPDRPVLVSRPRKAVYALIEPSFFERVVYNLLDNARKYSGPEQPIEVAVFDAGGRALLEVRDRGSGLDPGEISQIFGSFYRSPVTADKVPGKGLGLAVCRRLLQVMNGEIEAEPREGGGLVFRCSLPLARAA